MIITIDSRLKPIEYLEFQHCRHNLTGTYHGSYLRYLEYCWSHHLGVVLTPDIFQYTVLCEIAGLVRKNVEKYRHVFTDSPGKKELIIFSNDNVTMPLDKLADTLRAAMPEDVASVITRYSTTTERSLFARYAAFAAMASPYYNYSMLGCGIPHLSIDGVEDDWSLLYAQISQLLATFQHPYLVQVGKLCWEVLEQFDGPSVDFARNMFRLERCGSGSQTEVKGWWTEMYATQPSLQYVGNYPDHISRVKYTDIPTQKRYLMRNGIVTSHLEEQTAIPQYNHAIQEGWWSGD